MNILKKYLEKKGLTEFSQLSEEEKDTYRRWDDVLSVRKLTDDDVKEFLRNEVDEVQVKLVNPNLSQREDVFLKMKLDFIRKITLFLMSPEIEKRTLEQNITNLMQ